MKESTRAATQWDRANVSYLNYRADIPEGRDRYRLTLVDLLHVRNFKGGNSSVHVPESELRTKLKHWSHCLRRVGRLCRDRKLRNLSGELLARVREESTAFLEMADAGPHTPTGISGFRAAHASVLLHTRFPEVFPILDSRVLKGSGIVKKRRRAVPSDYPMLIDQVRRELRARPSVTIRDLDRKYFVKG